MMKMNKSFYTTIAAIVIFVLFLLCGTLCTKCADASDTSSEKKPMTRPMYDWHYGVIDDVVFVADVCGRNRNEDNAFIHIRKPVSGIGGDGTELWINVGDGYVLKWQNGCETRTYSVKFATNDYTKSFSSACTCVHNENGNVLRVDYPESIITLLGMSNKFQMTILNRGNVFDTYYFDVVKRFSWEN